MNAGHAEAIVASLGGKPVPELQCDLNEHFDKQVRVVLENAGYIDPEKIDDYIARDGYKALLTALTEMTPNGVIHRITESGLRGRGGGGYPTGLKWGTVAKAAGDAEVRGLQRRRGRSRRIHGSQRDGRRSASRHRRHGHRRLRGGRQQGLHLCPRRVSGGRLPADHRHPRGAAPRICWATASAIRPSTSTSKSASAPAPLSAARRRR